MVKVDTRIQNILINTQERLHVSERLNVDYLIDTEEYLDDYQRDILLNLSDSGFVSYKHILEECEPKYIDKYTRAYYQLRWMYDYNYKEEWE